MAAAGRCLSLLLLSTCVALLLQPPLGAQGAPMEPVYPGDNATPEQMAQYAAELRRYINMLTRPSAGPSCLPPRYGKRDKEDTLGFLEWGSPHAAAPRELSPMDL
uniref:Pancreatic polypeptide n=1 Tax=Equus caballus TaxID=9796 RepID=A0A3Q2HQX8_HORSE